MVCASEMRLPLKYDRTFAEPLQNPQFRVKVLYRA